MKPIILLTAAAAASLSAVPSGAKTAKEQPRPEAFEALVRCRSIADADARLKCFDTASAGLQDAAERRELVVVDRKQVRETRRSLFGLDLPNLGLFGGDGADGEGPEEDQVKSVEGVVASAYRDADNRWVVKLEDGATWGQTDNKGLLRPRPGTKVKIVRASLGTYMMRVGSQPGVRVKRRV